VFILDIQHRLEKTTRTRGYKCVFNINFFSPDASAKVKPRVPQRLPRGTADVIKLANRYSSLEDMSMDLGGASHSSPNTGKHK